MEISNRRSNSEEYQLRFGRLVQHRAEQGQNDLNFMMRECPKLPLQRAAAMAG